MVGLSNAVENQPEVLKWLMNSLARQYHVGIGKSMVNIRFVIFLFKALFKLPRERPYKGKMSIFNISNSYSSDERVANSSIWRYILIFG